MTVDTETMISITEVNQIFKND